MVTFPAWAARRAVRLGIGLGRRLRVQKAIASFRLGLERDGLLLRLVCGLACFDTGLLSARVAVAGICHGLAFFAAAPSICSFAATSCAG